MDILHVVQGYTPAIGGTEWMIQCISEELVRQFNDRVTVFTTDRLNAQGLVNPLAPRLPAGWEEINGVRIRRFRVLNQAGPFLKILQLAFYRLGLPHNHYLRTLYNGPIIPGLENQITCYPAQLIVAASFPFLHMYIALNAAKRNLHPCILIGCLHPEDDWGFQRSTIYDAIRKADRYLALTDYEAHYVITRGAAANRVDVAGGGVDPKIFQQFSSDEGKQKLGLAGQKVIGFIGQLGKHKGVDTLLRAMPLVWSQQPDIHLLIAGSRTSFIPHLERIIREWPTVYRRNLTLLYNFDEKDKGLLFSALDVFVYPSRYESFGIAFLEAWAAGKPVIGCRAGAITSVIQQDQDGLFVVPGDEAQLSGAILSLVQNPGLAFQMGQSGRQKVLAHYTWPQIARRFRESYQAALDQCDNQAFK